MKNLTIKFLSLVFILVMIPATVAGCSKEESADNSTRGTESVAGGLSSSLEQFKNLGFVTYNEPAEVPAFEVPGIKGGSFNTEALKGKVTILNFWAPWCPPCQSEMPHLQEFYKEFKDKKDFQLVATAIRDSKASVEAFMTDNKYTFPTYIDEDISYVGLFVSQGIPVTYIVNKNGKIIAAYTGAYNFTSAEFKAAIEGMLE